VDSALEGTIASAVANKAGERGADQSAVVEEHFRIFQVAVSADMLAAETAM
jgi:hypothetical protein